MGENSQGQLRESERAEVPKMQPESTNIEEISRRDGA